MPHLEPCRWHVVITLLAQELVKVEPSIPFQLPTQQWIRLQYFREKIPSLHQSLHKKPPDLFSSQIVVKDLQISLSFLKLGLQLPTQDPVAIIHALVVQLALSSCQVLIDIFPPCMVPPCTCLTHVLDAIWTLLGTAVSRFLTGVNPGAHHLVHRSGAHRTEKPQSRVRKLPLVQRLLVTCPLG